MYQVTLGSDPEKYAFVTADDFMVTGNGALVFFKDGKNRRAFADGTWLAVEPYYGGADA